MKTNSGRTEGQAKGIVAILLACFATITNLVGADSNPVTARIGGGAIDPVIFPLSLPFGSLQQAQDFEACEVTHVEVGLQHLPPGATTWVGLPSMSYEVVPTNKSDLQAMTGNLIAKHMSAYAKYFKDPALGAGQMALAIECFVDDGAYYNVPLYIMDGNYERNIFVSRTLFHFTDHAPDGTWILPVSAVQEAITALHEPDGNVFVNLPWLTDVQGNTTVDIPPLEPVAGLFYGNGGHILGAMINKKIIGTKSPTVITFVSQSDIAWYDETGAGTGGQPLRIVEMVRPRDFHGTPYSWFQIFCYLLPGQSVVVQSSSDLNTWTSVQALSGDWFGKLTYDSRGDGNGLSVAQLQTLRSWQQAMGDKPPKLFYRARYK